MRRKLFFFAVFLLIILLNTSFSNICEAKTLTGNINKEDFVEKSNIVVDGMTGNPVSGASVSIPTEGIFTKTNDYGQFKLDASIKTPAILSVQANGYKPFSVTISDGKIKKPLILVVTKLFGNETVIDNEIHHLGDNKFSLNSANAKDFQLKSEGAVFLKEFFVGNIDSKDDSVLKIGSIVGLDTEMSKRLGQSKVKTSTSSPMSVFLNSQKVGEIRINGDNQEISLPKNLLKPNSYNIIKIKTGINEDATSYIDYDDMEFMNILLVVR